MTTSGDQPSQSSELAYSWHALIVMAEREILPEWVEATVSDPVLRTNDPHDSAVERFYRTIPARNRRVLRVAVNTRVAPWRVVSVFFDRRMRGRI